MQNFISMEQILRKTQIHSEKTESNSGNVQDKVGVEGWKWFSYDHKILIYEEGTIKNKSGKSMLSQTIARKPAIRLGASIARACI